MSSELEKVFKDIGKTIAQQSERVRKLEVRDTISNKVSVMTTVQRDALSPVNGMFIYNSTLNKFQGYEDSAWVDIMDAATIQNILDRLDDLETTWSCFQYDVTVLAGESTHPKITFTSGTARFNWGDDSALDTITSGVEFTHTYTVGGTYTVKLMLASQFTLVTRIDISSDKVVGNVTPMKYFTNLTYFYGNANANWVQYLTGWSLPASLLVMSISGTGVWGDITNWILPTTMVTFSIYNTDLTGDVTMWIIPTTLTGFYANNTDITGSVRDWGLPAGLINLSINNTVLYGDISGWTIPAAMTTLNLILTAVSGDVTAWVIPASMVYIGLSWTYVTGSVAGWTLPATLTSFYVNETYLYNVPILTSMVAIQIIKANNCGLTQAMVDTYLAECAAREASCTYATPVLDLGDVNGGNQPPSAGGLVDKAILDAAGWVVTVMTLIAEDLETPALQPAMWNAILDEQWVTFDTSVWKKATETYGYITRTAAQVTLVPGTGLRLTVTDVLINGNYVGGRISSRTYYQYGYFEWKAKLPGGAGIAGTLWLYEDTAQAPRPETDVMEYRGIEKFTATNHLYGSTTGISFKTHDLFITGMHTYGLQWSPTRSTIYFDGIPVAILTNYVPQTAMRIECSNYAGGPWAGTPPATTVFPGELDIEYIKVWQRI